MSTPHEPAQTQPDELQFDQAEFAVESPAARSEPTRCAACKSTHRRRLLRSRRENRLHFLPRQDRDGSARVAQGSLAPSRSLVLGAIAAAIGAIPLLCDHQDHRLEHRIWWQSSSGCWSGERSRPGREIEADGSISYSRFFLTYSSIVVMHVPLAIEAQEP